MNKAPPIVRKNIIMQVQNVARHYKVSNGLLRGKVRLKPLMVQVLSLKQEAHSRLSASLGVGNRL